MILQSVEYNHQCFSILFFNYFLIQYFIIQIYMFTEFLHPQLVLFGEFINPKIKTNHSVEILNGEFMVHQRIQRRPPLKQNAQSFNRINNRQNDNQEDQQEQDYEGKKYQQDRYGYGDDEDYQDDQEDYDQQPYGEEQYAYGIEDEEVPHEIASIIHQAMLQKNQKKIQNKAIPFISSLPNHKQQTNNTKPTVQAQNIENDDNDWETEEEEQDYLSAELMEQAGGVFEGQLGEM